MAIYDCVITFVEQNLKQKNCLKLFISFYITNYSHICVIDTLFDLKFLYLFISLTTATYMLLLLCLISNFYIFLYHKL